MRRKIGHVLIDIGRRGGFIESPRWRHRFVYHLWLLDTEPWRDERCPHCGLPFTEDPRFSCTAERMHLDCGLTDGHRHSWGTHADEYDEEEVES